MIGLALAIAGVARSPASSPAAADGTLIVREHQLPADGMYIEGYVSFLRVHDADGDVVMYRRFDVGDPRVHLYVTLSPGSYTVTRFIRPCDGNCGYLDRPTERCSQALKLAPEKTTVAVARTRVGHRCDIRIH
jgi:hypothetical protein